MEKKRTDHGNKKRGYNRSQSTPYRANADGDEKLIQAIAPEMGSKCRQLFALRSLIGPTERGLPTVIGQDSTLTVG